MSDTKKNQGSHLNVQAREVPLSTLNAVLPGLGDHIKKKTLFTKKNSPYMHFEWLSSDQLQANIDDALPELRDILSDKDYLRMNCRLNKCQLNVGVITGSGWREAGLKSAMSDKEFMLFVDYFIGQGQKAIEFGLATANERPLGFSRSSSPGGSTSPEISQFNFKYDAESKYAILNHVKKTISGEIPFPATYFGSVGFRLQMQGPKARPSVVFNDNHKLESDSTTGYETDQRVRHVMGFGWESTALGMGWNECLNYGISHSPELLHLKSLYKSTHNDIDDLKNNNLYEKASDVSNNDAYIPAELLAYVAEGLLPPRIFTEWEKANEECMIGGGYYDSNEKARYYLLKLEKNDGFSRLWSGDFYTSVLNRFIHAPNQFFSRYKSGQFSKIENLTDVDSFVKQILSDKLVFNNGDDYLDFFKSQKEADDYEKFQGSNPYFDIGIEPPGFSGPSHIVNNDGTFGGVETSIATLFAKTAEVERRPVGHPIRSLSYNSVLGKIDNFLEYNYRSQGVNDVVYELFMKTIGLEDIDSYDHLKQLALDELKNQDESDVRQKAILLLMEKLNETQAHVLSWKYTFAELKAIDAAAAEELFIALPLADFVDLKFTFPKDRQV